MKTQFIVLCMILPWLTGCKDEKSEPIQTEEVSEISSLKNKLTNLKGRVNLVQVKKLFDDVRPGHGAYFYAKLEGNIEVWFYIDYFTGKGEHETSSTDQTCYIGAISLVRNNDSDKQEFLWPTEYKGLSLKEAYGKLYPDRDKD